MQSESQRFTYRSTSYRPKVGHLPQDLWRLCTCNVLEGCHIGRRRRILAPHRAELFLTRHELFHAAVEIACTRAELLSRRSLYREFFCDSKGGFLEEALATAQSLRFIDTETEEGVKLFKLMRHQGEGYATLIRGLIRGLQLGQRKVGPNHGPTTRRTEAPHVRVVAYLSVSRRREISLNSPPVTRLDDLGVGSASILRPFPKDFGIQIDVHSRDHPPPHIHVRTLSGEQETRYAWPEMKPLAGNPLLSARDRQNLRKYLARHGDAVERKVKTAYPATA